MRYFWLQQDERITDRPYPRDLWDKIDVRKVSAEEGNVIPFQTLVRIRSSQFIVFPDVLNTPVLLTTQKAQDIIKLYNEDMDYRQIVYLDQETARVQLYFIPLLNTIDCLSPRSEYVNAGKGAFSKVVLNRAPIGDENIFQVQNSTERVVIIRLDLVERLLAFGCQGFTLTEAEIVSGEELSWQN